jgi:hypothetical protein
VPIFGNFARFSTEFSGLEREKLGGPFEPILYRTDVNLTLSS